MSATRSRFERMITRVFDDADPAGFGTGWMSGTGGVFLGALALAGVLVFQYPGVLSTETFRAQYPIGVLRALLQIVIGAAFLLAATSLVLRRRKVLGLVGLGLTLLATVGGGAEAAARPTPPSAPRSDSTGSCSTCCCSPSSSSRSSARFLIDRSPRRSGRGGRPTGCI